MNKKLTGGYADEKSFKVTPKRQSIKPTFDSRKTGPAYYVSTSVNDRHVGTQDIQDPFANTTVRVGWIDLLRGLLKRGLLVRVMINARDQQLVEDVMELDSNYLSSNSTRRDEWNKELGQKIQDHVTRETGEE